MTKKDPIVIVGAKRTPTGNFNGCFKDTSVIQLGAAAIHATLKQSNFRTETVDEIIMGCVLPAGLGQAPARQAALAAGISTKTGCTTINKMCGSGMKAIMQAHDAIVAGSISRAIAGGMENMSRAPYLLPKARFGYRFGHGQIIDHMMLDGLEDAYEKGRPMGYFAEECVKKYNFTREAQDDFARESQSRAQQAAKQGKFNDEISPVTIRTPKHEITIAEDEGPQTVNPDKIPQLKPAFIPEGTITAANASSISDGAAAVALMRESQAIKNGSKPLAKIVGHYTHAQKPELFTTAPIGAINGLLKQLAWNINDIDLFEINEAFAVVTMAAMKDLKIPHEKININGGACVLGHPIGASGARILITLLYALQHHQLKRGIAALCIGGGEATAIAIEMV